MWGAAAGGALAATGGPAFAKPSAYGRFIGTVSTSWAADGRHMRLLDSFTYVDPSGEDWIVPAGATVDGASIPRAAWSLIGGPFEGRYRNASVVHDWYCDVRTRPWRDVHRMFLNGMLAAGVDEPTARLMYFAVYAGGPRWDDQAIANNQVAIEQKVAQLAQDPAPSVLQTCSNGGGNCNLIYSSMGGGARAEIASAHGGSWLGRMVMGIFPHAAAPPPPSPAPPLPTRYETVAIGGETLPPPVADPDQILALARRLASSNKGLGEAELEIDAAR